MRKFLSLFITLCVLASVSLTAQTVSTTSTLQSVTVYSNGAELSHSAKANIPSGSSEVVIKNVSSVLDENTIQVGSTADLTIMSVSFRREFIEAKPKSAAVLRLEDSLKAASKELTSIGSQIAIHQNTISVLDANKIVRGDNVGLNVAELQKMVDYYLSKQTELSIKIAGLQEKQSKQSEYINKLQQQLAELNAQGVNDAKGEIVLQVMADAATATTFSIGYISYTAAWSPMYDLKAKDTKSNLKILYKANVVQNTGLDWNKVKLSISTGNPSQGGTAPILSAWFLNYYTPMYKAKQGAYYNQQAPVPPPSLTNTIQSFSADGGTADGEAASVSDFTTVSETALNAVFDIDLAYDIPSDNKAHAVTMKEYELPVLYKYYAVPKMDKDAFLLAEVADWESLNLVPGPANIIFDGTYIGKGFIDPVSTQDTLNLSLGRDKKIVVKREKLQDFCSAKMVGTNRMHTVTYELRVKNTRKEAINMLLKDQYPLSTNKEIEIQLLEDSGAMVNTETGILTWKLDIAPGETKKVRVSYSVKYPKDKQIAPLWP
ncbi:MAG: hypothetical protein RL660_842 [Bacteroidota bacterium]|jgi:uncharacterized protein (TIGR02231 family)